MQSLVSTRTRRVIELALGYSVEAPAEHRPILSFDLAPELAKLEATPVATIDRESVSRQIQDAYFWCQLRFPLAVRSPSVRTVIAIEHINVARCARSVGYVTASSPQRPFFIFVAAHWPLPGIFRLSSLLAHEAMHQALYERERHSRVARHRSLAYSPWKQCLRPGRLVWHAVWTFVGQFVLLGDAITKDRESLMKADASLLDFLAEMEMRIDCCVQSLAQFEILDSEETRRVADAMVEVHAIGDELVAADDEYKYRRAIWLDIVTGEIESWSAREFAVTGAA
jgi:hypothetical protein